MSAAACKIIIDDASGLIGKLACVAGSAPIADTATPGTVTPGLAAEFRHRAARFEHYLADMIDTMAAGIPEDAEVVARPPSGINRGDTDPGAGD